MKAEDRKIKEQAFWGLQPALSETTLEHYTRSSYIQIGN